MLTVSSHTAHRAAHTLLPVSSTTARHQLTSCYASNAGTLKSVSIQYSECKSDHIPVSHCIQDRRAMPVHDVRYSGFRMESDAFQHSSPTHIDDVSYKVLTESPRSPRIIHGDKIILGAQIIQGGSYLAMIILEEAHRLNYMLTIFLKNDLVLMMYLYVFILSNKIWRINSILGMGGWSE